MVSYNDMLNYNTTVRTEERSVASFLANYISLMTSMKGYESVEVNKGSQMLIVPRL